MYAHQGVCEVAKSQRATEEELTGKISPTVLGLEILISNLCVASDALPFLRFASVFDLTQLGASCRFLQKVSLREMNQNFWERVCHQLVISGVKFIAQYTGESELVYPTEGSLVSGGDWKRAFQEEVKALFMGGLKPKRLEWYLQRDLEFKEEVDDDLNLIWSERPMPIEWYTRAWALSEQRTEFYVKHLTRNSTVMLEENWKASFEENYCYGQKFRWFRYHIKGEGTWSFSDTAVTLTLNYERKEGDSDDRIPPTFGTCTLKIPLMKFYHQGSRLRSQPDWELALYKTS
jgi:hypothetical protein